MSDENPASNKPATVGTEGPLVIRAWPKILLMLPTLIISLLCGLVMAIKGVPPADAQFGAIQHWAGLLFILVLGINLTMVLYDLNLRGFIIVALLIAVLLLLISLLGSGSEDESSIWSKLASILSVRLVANSAFYFVFSLVLIFNLAIAWVITRFNYWVVEHNEIIIHKGFMQEVERHPTAQSRFKLKIDDVVEYGVLGVGTLVFYFGDDDTEHQLLTVPFVHKKAKRLDQLLGRVAVVSNT